LFFLNLSTEESPRHPKDKAATAATISGEGWEKLPFIWLRKRVTHRLNPETIPINLLEDRTPDSSWRSSEIQRAIFFMPGLTNFELSIERREQICHK
jgi:hypothetical protein